MNNIAVILPVYKNDKLSFFKDAITSVLNQTLLDFSLFIVKDGPLTYELDSFLGTVKDHRVRVLELKENMGLPVALNFGIRNAKELGFKFIARMDADDVSHPDRFENQLAFLKNNSEYDLVGSSAVLINENSKRIGVKNVKQVFEFSDLIKNCEIIHPSVLFRSSFFDKAGYYDESLKKSQDYDLWLRASKEGLKMGNLKECLIDFRYEVQIIERRKNEQKYNIQIKQKYFKGMSLYLSVIPHLIIMILPKVVLKAILKYRLNQGL